MVWQGRGREEGKHGRRVRGLEEGGEARRGEERGGLAGVLNRLLSLGKHYLGS